MPHIGVTPVPKAAWRRRGGRVIAPTDTLNVPHGYAVGYLKVEINGRALLEDEFVAKDGQTVKISQVLPEGTSYAFEVVEPFQAMDHYTKKEAAALAGGTLADFEESPLIAGVAVYRTIPWTPLFHTYGGFVSSVHSVNASICVQQGKLVTCFLRARLDAANTMEDGTFGITLPSNASSLRMGSGECFLYRTISSAENGVGTIAPRGEYDKMYGHIKRAFTNQTADLEFSLRLSYVSE